jgi:hypothetical protein
VEIVSGNARFRQHEAVGAGKTVIVTSEGLSPISVSHPHLLGSLWAAFEAGFRAAANVRRQDEDDRAESAGDPL